jgi:hypothetical protein
VWNEFGDIGFDFACIGYDRAVVFRPVVPGAVNPGPVVTGARRPDGIGERHDRLPVHGRRHHGLLRDTGLRVHGARAEHEGGGVLIPDVPGGRRRRADARDRGVTDQAGDLADGWASVRGTPSEPVLAPSDALGPLAGFLGAMLGQDAGTSLLPWLAGHLGDVHAETTSGTIRVAVYTASPTDHASLYVEVASRTYVASPGVPAP